MQKIITYALPWTTHTCWYRILFESEFQTIKLKLGYCFSQKVGLLWFLIPVSHYPDFFSNISPTKTFCLLIWKGECPVSLCNQQTGWIGGVFKKYAIYLTSGSILWLYYILIIKNPNDTSLFENGYCNILMAWAVAHVWSYPGLIDWTTRRRRIWINSFIYVSK